MENETTQDALLGVVHPTTENTRSRILGDALSLVNGERQNDYGPPSENMARIRDFWNTYLSNATGLDIELESRQVADLMILVKVARLIQSPKEDSYVDIIGYAAIGAELSE